MPHGSKKAGTISLFPTILSLGLGCLIILLMIPNIIRACPSSVSAAVVHHAVHEGGTFSGNRERFEIARNFLSSGQELFQGTGETSAQGSDNHLLYGPFCHWSGSSGGGSGYSHTIRAFFDGQGRFKYSSESAFSGEAGQAHGTEGDDSSAGAYRVVGDRVFLSFSDGSTEVALVHNRAAGGIITELMYDGDLYAPALCQ